MTDRLYNFSAGPATLPESVLVEARDNLLSLHGTGIGILEHSHRGKAFSAVYEETVANCRKIADISDDYDILFLQGGASTQFFMVPMNCLSADQTADYHVTGTWSKKAITEAKRFGNVHIACSSEEKNFCEIPRTVSASESPIYTHYTSNNTIFGTQYSAKPEMPNGGFLVCDASSDIFSRSIDVNKYGIIYAGAQKNLGPSGLALVIIRKDIVERGAPELPSLLQYRTQAAADSMFNTPPTFGIYMMGLVFKWILQQGGLSAMETANRKKAAELYAAIDSSERFTATVAEGSRSQMNVTFVSGDAELDAQFLAAADAAGFSGLKGHRVVGGMRASIYNAFPANGITEFTKFLHDFEAAL